MFNERWRLSINGWREMLRQEPCGYCSRVGRDRGTVDHIIPRSQKPPSYHWDNLAAACFGCNTRRGDIPSLRFLLKRGRLAVKLRTEVGVQAAMGIYRPLDSEQGQTDERRRR